MSDSSFEEINELADEPRLAGGLTAEGAEEHPHEHLEEDETDDDSLDEHLNRIFARLPIEGADGHFRKNPEEDETKSFGGHINQDTDESIDGSADDWEDERYLTEIVPRGDVIICIRDGRLLVSSQVLSLASPVFKAKINSEISEANQAPFPSPCSIELEDEDYNPIYYLCSILHCAYELLEGYLPHDTVPTDLLVGILVSLTKVAKKYDCVRPVSLWAGDILSRLASYTHEPHATQILCVAYHLGLQKVFAEITKRNLYESNPEQLATPLIPVWSAWGREQENWFWGDQPKHVFRMLAHFTSASFLLFTNYGARSACS